MLRDIEQMQLLMALSLYINSITMNPPTFIPATPEMLFGTEINDEEIESDDLEYEYQEEADVSEESEAFSSTPTCASSNLNIENRIVDLDITESLQGSELSLVQPA